MPMDAPSPDENLIAGKCNPIFMIMVSVKSHKGE